MMSAPAVFLDRDGTLMENVGYCHRAEDVRVFPGVREALDRLRAAGFRLVIVTNQSGIARGYFPEAAYHAVQAELRRQIGLVDAEYFCPEAPDNASDRRKPGAGMVREAAVEHDLDLARSYLIGDHDSDILCARRAGLAGAALVLTGHGATQARACEPDSTAPDFAAAAQWVLTDCARFTSLTA